MSGDIVIIGGGPAGICCAHELTQLGHHPTIWERHNQLGGLCRTINYKGYYFDIGPHRFFTKNQEIDELWHKVLGDDVLTVDRLTRIMYRDHFFQYPLKPLDALKGLGMITSAQALMDYALERFRKNRDPASNFEEWVRSQFGNKLFDIFFRTYTEKVWGVPCASISADWAEQRIKGLNMGKAMLYGLFPMLNKQGKVKSLVDTFDYPRKGAGQVFENLGSLAISNGATIVLDMLATAVHHRDGQIVGVEGSSNGKTNKTTVDHLFSSIPITELVMRLKPLPPEAVLEACRDLYYRDHITVNLVLDGSDLFPDNWIYVHSPEVRAARIANYNNFSKEMVPRQDRTALSVEYFAFAHESLWHKTDDELIRLALKELAKLKLIKIDQYIDGFVVKERNSYPSYHLDYKASLKIVRDYVDQFENLALIGRGGMYKYNNQDHSMLSGLTAARKFAGEDVDLWEINVEQEYLEEKQLPTPIHANTKE